MEYRLNATHGGRSLTFLHSSPDRQRAIDWARLKVENLSAKLDNVRLLEREHAGFRSAWIEVWRR